MRRLGCGLIFLKAASGVATVPRSTHPDRRRAAPPQTSGEKMQPRPSNDKNMNVGASARPRRDHLALLPSTWCRAKLFATECATKHCAGFVSMSMKFELKFVFDYFTAGPMGSVDRVRGVSAASPRCHLASQCVDRDKYIPVCSKNPSARIRALDPVEQDTAGLQAESDS